MRVYFLSRQPAALSADGQYLGMIDGFERYIDLPAQTAPFIEIAPTQNFQPVRFVLNDAFWACPPEDCSVFVWEDEAIISISKFPCLGGRLQVTYQNRHHGALLTVVKQGELTLYCEGKQTHLHPLPAAFCNCTGQEYWLSGLPVVALCAQKWLCLLSQEGNLLFLGEVENFTIDATLRLSVRFATCAALQCQCEYSYDGNALHQISSVTQETEQAPPEIIHFAFFESVLTRGDYAKYLCEQLKPNAEQVKEYLGAFCQVILPTEKFLQKHGDIACAGLAYAKSKNLFAVRFYGVEIENDSISNIFEVE